MASDRKFIPFRPDDTEAVLMAKLTEKHGLPMARVIGQAVRQMAQRDGLKATKEEIAEEKARRENKQKKTGQGDNTEIT